jgi:hypothetical protein
MQYSDSKVVYPSVTIVRTSPLLYASLGGKSCTGMLSLPNS